uniref:protein phosphatase 1 regulatory inhibitor subunit PPP1R8 homolog n=1 Tax=Erigeron canadensis TaxID=72917 RepID=UPI001CB9152B|nr:protein phosphatase 1 regulatory inhibitor subunit PPP1R8 homolog [Erigeron canadensis]
MYGRTGGGLERFKKAQTLQPFQQTLSDSQPLKDDSSASANNKDSTVVGGWQAPDWAIEPRPGLFFLDVFKDGQLLDRIPLDKRTHIFGRQLHSCHFVLDHQSVSRQHAALVPHKNGSLYVIDLGSAHGTFVANERLTKHSPVELEVGQSLRFAASTRVYILKKDNALLFPPPPPPLPNLPPPPPPSDEQAVLAYNTFLNRHRLSNSLDNHTERPSKRSKKSRVAFRDQVGGDLVEVVGVSDGADVDTEPGPVGVKEGSSLVGKYESLVQTTVIPRGKESKEVSISPNGVTDKLQQVLNRVKAPPKAGMYDDLYGDSLSTKAGSSWAYSSNPSGGREAIPVRSNSNIDDSDDDLFG